MRDGARQVLAKTLGDLEGNKILINLRIDGPQQIAEGTWGNAPLVLEGEVVRVIGEEVLVIGGIATVPGMGNVERKQHILIDDILTVNQIGTVAAPSKSILTG